MITSVEPTNFDGASIMIEACRTELARSGFTEQAQAISGMELLSVTSAKLALETLKSITGITGEAADLRRYTIATLESLLPDAKRMAS